MSWKYLLFALAAVFLTITVVEAVPAHIWVSPTSPKQSVFFRTFDASKVIQSFRVPCTPTSGSYDLRSQTASSYSSSAGYHFLNQVKDIEFRRTVEPAFCADPQQHSALMIALHESLLGSLASSGCQLTGDQLTSREGARVEYRCGAKVYGVAVVHAPNKTLGEADRHVTFRIEVDERWRVGA